MITTYKEIPIQYDEHENHWTFTLRNKERICASLKLAKEVIDKPVRDNEDKFDAISGWKSEFSGPPVHGRITSQAADRYYGKSYWFVSDKKERSKIRATDFYPETDFNKAIVGEVTELAAQIEKLEKARYAMQKKLKPLSTVE